MPYYLVCSGGRPLGPSASFEDRFGAGGPSRSIVVKTVAVAPSTTGTDSSIENIVGSDNFGSSNVVGYGTNEVENAVGYNGYVIGN